MTPSEIIFHRRVRVLEHAAKTWVTREAHRVFGVSWPTGSMTGSASLRPLGWMR